MTSLRAQGQPPDTASLDSVLDDHHGRVATRIQVIALHDRIEQGLAQRAR